MRHQKSRVSSLGKAPNPVLILSPFRLISGYHKRTRTHYANALPYAAKKDVARASVITRKVISSSKQLPENMVGLGSLVKTVDRPAKSIESKDNLDHVSYSLCQQS
jgi:hypothetical protein